MKKGKIWSIMAILLAVILTASSLPMASGEKPERMLIEYKPGMGTAVRNAVLRAGGKVHYEFNRINVLAVSIAPSWAQQFAGDPRVVLVEPDAKRYPAADPLPVLDALEGQVVPYGIDLVQAPLAVEAGADGEGVTVCIIDTGLYQAHEDIDDNYVIGGVSQDPSSAWDQDGYGHGTHVAGTITAADNDLGVIGVSPGKISLFMVKVFGQDGLWTESSDLIAAAYTCQENGANIINMSLSGSAGPNAEEKAFDDLYYNLGVLSVAAASNDGNNHKAFPASFESVISVAAIDQNMVVADFSNQNKWVELAAPGVGVLSTVPFIPDSWLNVSDHSFQGQPMEYSPYGSASGELVEGGLCTASGDWAGKVVLCARGDNTFAEKVTNVMDGGGVAAVIYNNIEGLFSGTLGEEGDWIVAISISDTDGELALGHLGETAVVGSAPPIEGSGYEAWNGTSMATPHVAGVAALLWSANPQWTNIEIREAMNATALDLGEPGRDIAYGYGLVQAYDALQYLLQHGNGHH